MQHPGCTALTVLFMFDSSSVSLMEVTLHVSLGEYFEMIMIARIFKKKTRKILLLLVRIQKLTLQCSWIIKIFSSEISHIQLARHQTKPGSNCCKLLLEAIEEAKELLETEIVCPLLLLKRFVHVALLGVL